MGLFDFIKKNKPKPENTQPHAAMLNGYTPIFTQFGRDIYASDVVQQSIHCIVTEMKKLTPKHIRKNGSDSIPINSDIQRILDHPNDLMTQSDFLEKVIWQLFLNYNSFIIPVYDYVYDDKGNRYKKFTGLWPVQPTQVDFLQDASERLYVKLKFANEYAVTLDYRDVIHIRYKFSVNEYMGGNVFGQPDNEALLETLELNKSLLQGISNALKSSFTINGVVKFNTMMDDLNQVAELQKLEAKIKANESGFLPMDIKGEFIPIKREVQLVDDNTLKFIDTKILRQFGVPLAILTGDYTKAQYEAFYQKTLEPLIISISQAFTKSLFTPREISFGNKIMFFSKELIFMDTTQKLEMVRLLGDSGSMYENEKRAAFGLPPLAELEGVIRQSLNYVDSEIAKEYQLKNISQTQDPPPDDDGDGESGENVLPDDDGGSNAE